MNSIQVGEVIITTSTRKGGLTSGTLKEPRGVKGGINAFF